jgi:hypothetical protein
VLEVIKRLFCCFEICMCFCNLIQLELRFSIIAVVVVAVVVVVVVVVVFFVLLFVMFVVNVWPVH